MPLNNDIHRSRAQQNPKWTPKRTPNGTPNGIQIGTANGTQKGPNLRLGPFGVPFGVPIWYPLLGPIWAPIWGPFFGVPFGSFWVPVSPRYPSKPLETLVGAGGQARKNMMNAFQGWHCSCWPTMLYWSHEDPKLYTKWPAQRATEAQAEPRAWSRLSPVPGPGWAPPAPGGSGPKT